MMRNRLFPVGALALGLALAVTSTPSARAEEKAKAAAKAPTQEEMMKAWQAYATPGEGQKKLDAFAGSWTVKMKSWMEPGTPPEESEGTAENTWVLGGRYLAQKYDGKMMGQPFSGMGYTGFDNYKKKYQSVWMDNLGTGLMISTGSFDKTGKVMHFTATMDDFMTGKKTTVKEALTIVDADTHKLEMWMSGPDGKMSKSMEMSYTRKK